MVFSFARRSRSGAARIALFRKIVIRSLVIIGIGVLLNGFPSYDLATLRYPGVLQRIGLVYLVSATLYLTTGPRIQRWTAAGLLVSYWAVMTLVPVPGYGRGVLAPDGNPAQYLDNLVFAGHMWKPTWDPEGLLSTLPAVGTCLIGLLTGQLLQSEFSSEEKLIRMLLWGDAAILVGAAWGAWFPINKSLWTSSYVLLTAGIALQIFGACYWLIDMRGIRAWARPFAILGVNAMAVFVLSGILARLLVVWRVQDASGRSVTMMSYIYDHWLVPFAGPLNGSLLFALGYLLLWLLVMTFFYRRSWLLRA
jgi:predicted acyltransferase